MSCPAGRGRVRPQGRGEAGCASETSPTEEGFCLEPAAASSPVSQTRAQEEGEGREGKELLQPLFLPPSLSPLSLAVLRRVISRQITGAARTCPLSTVWIFRVCEAGVRREKRMARKFRAVGCVFAFPLLGGKWTEATMLGKRAKAWFFCCSFPLKAEP